jgi:heme/copper-type cytochrome/quinol oxidase subunit 3
MGPAMSEYPLPAGGVPQERQFDVSNVPTVVFGMRSILWWGTIGMAVIEGTFFCILIGSYFFLRSRVSDWPPNGVSPNILWGTINTIIFLVSLIPNHWTKKQAKAGNLRNVQIGLLLMDALGLIIIFFRIFEFPSLGVTWSANAYGSVVWVLLGFHTFHLVTDWGDSIVLTAVMFTKKVEGTRFMDCYENCDYWYFVVAAWIPVYLVIYWATRIL